MQHDIVRGQTEQHVRNMFLKFSLNQAKYSKIIKTGFASYRWKYAYWKGDIQLRVGFGQGCFGSGFDLFISLSNSLLIN